MGEENAHSNHGIDEPLRLPPKLDLRASMDLADALRARRGGNLTIDAGNVQHLGAHAVQTLLVAANSWSRDGKSLTVAHLPDAAVGQLSIMGLEPHRLSSGGAT